jgi:hypothetical protein
VDNGRAVSEQPRNVVGTNRSTKGTPMFDPDDFSYDTSPDSYRSGSYDEPWDADDTLRDGGRLTHLVFVDGRIVDAWSEDVRGTRFERIARELEREKHPAPVPEPPMHRQVLEWLDALVGGRAELLCLTEAADRVVPLRDHLDPVTDEPWLLVDEHLQVALEAVLPEDQAAPLRRCLLLLRERHPAIVDRTTPDRLAAGIIWVVGKANGTLGPTGPVVQKEISELLGSPTLSQCSHLVYGHVRRIGWARPRPWRRDVNDLLATGRLELLGRQTRADLVRLRDEALGEQRASSCPEPSAS